MNAEFNWWLLIVGLVVGAGLVWLVVLDSRRRDADIDEAEMAREALWLSTLLGDDGIDVSPATAGRRRAHLAARSNSPAVRARIGSSRRNRCRSSPSTAALA